MDYSHTRNVFSDYRREPIQISQLEDNGFQTQANQYINKLTRDYLQRILSAYLMSAIIAKRCGKLKLCNPFGIFIYRKMLFGDFSYADKVVFE